MHHLVAAREDVCARAQLRERHARVSRRVRALFVRELEEPNRQMRGAVVHHHEPPRLVWRQRHVLESCREGLVHEQHTGGCAQ